MQVRSRVRQGAHSILLGCLLGKANQEEKGSNNRQARLGRIREGRIHLSPGVASNGQDGLAPCSLTTKAARGQMHGRQGAVALILLTKLAVTFPIHQVSAAALGAAALPRAPRHAARLAGSRGARKNLLLLASPAPILSAALTRPLTSAAPTSGWFPAEKRDTAQRRGTRGLWGGVLRRATAAAMNFLSATRGGGEGDFGGSRPKVVVITGPTAVGKSAAAERIALKAPGGAELISADSVQVYIGMDIGSAKPTAAEQAAVRYHLLDLVPPSEEYSAADFAAAARAAIADVAGRGALPIVVGGTGFYIQWLVFGNPGAPAPTPAATAAADAEVAAFAGDWDAALRRAEEVDAAYAMTLSVNDWFRLKRMLEVWHTSGRPMTAYDRPKGKGAAPADVPAALAGSECDFRCFFLHRPRVQLFRDIDLRCEQMLQVPHRPWRDRAGLPRAPPPNLALTAARGAARRGAARRRRAFSTRWRAWCARAPFAFRSPPPVLTGHISSPLPY